ncbi:hypothetical protein IQ266_16420 [filamentous cyanobacterium LEGE 11480]|uniref:Uncharacterized protein n=1 Tax=Romeriopsis navalis LEGE 11480 TaxID=2777977 RepID=A0A928Z3A7_9CYAN|nr:hypothetical protein [Romeriopsis navalis]MBE9031321.1 hypothetical protein [Romeriopsis navalis LEGE 11480]
MQAPPKEKEFPPQKPRNRFNTFKLGFVSGIIVAALAGAGLWHVVVNVFRFDPVNLTASRVGGDVNSPKTETTQTTVNQTTAPQKDNTISVKGEDNGDTNPVIANEKSQIKQEDSSQSVGSNITAGGNVTLNIYKDNSELAGFNAGKEYTSKPPSIGKFDDAILISDVSFGSRYFKSQTRDVFIQKKKYKSTFQLRANSTNSTRVAFSLKNTKPAKGVFLQFGLGDWSSGTNTLTYLVKISADGKLLWSGQVKYVERQIASVVLDVQGYEDIFLEYQVVEAGGAGIRDNPLFFTEAKLLF